MRPFITTFRFLRTVARRSGLEKVFVGVSVIDNNSVYLFKHADFYHLPSVELGNDLDFMQAISTLVDAKFSLVKYLGSFTTDTSWQFNFQLDMDSRKLPASFVPVSLDSINSVRISDVSLKLIKKSLF